MTLKRSSGILLPVSALPSPYGIGTFGKAAYQFIDFLAASGQTWWQILPLGTTGYGNSPYQSFSAFAGNPYFIDLDFLIEAGLLEKAEVQITAACEDPRRIDYGNLYTWRMSVLKKAAERGLKLHETNYAKFKKENDFWLKDFSLYMALKQKFNMQSWQQWPDAKLRAFDQKAINKARSQFEDQIEILNFIQYIFFAQWHKLHAYANRKGIKILGDIPLYVALDSVDVWSGTKNYQLKEDFTPEMVSGVPPDYFNSDGQLWSNPLYDWQKMAGNGYLWWLRRIGVSTKIYDGLRIDHFRGLESYWAVPANETTAQNGKWMKGPGMGLISVLKETYPEFTFVAEDLGYQTKAVQDLLCDSGFPGMNVLQLAFDYRDSGNLLPHEFTNHSVCYLGTHDNAPIMAWLSSANQEDVDLAIKYIGLNDAEGKNWGFIRAGMGSVSNLFIGQMQDFLGLGANSRMNIPGKVSNNWEWRILASDLSPRLASRIFNYTQMFGRLSDQEQ